MLLKNERCLMSHLPPGIVAFTGYKIVKAGLLLGSQTFTTNIQAMRKIILQEFITLDGVMQAPGAPDEDTSDGFKFE